MLIRYDVRAKSTFFILAGQELAPDHFAMIS